MSNLPNTPPTDAEITAAALNCMAERASGGVRIAQAIKNISCKDGVVTAIFDPAKTGITVELFHDINKFGNLAQFVGTPFAFNDDDGKWFRQSLVRIDTALSDGSSLGTLTTAELHKMAESRSARNSAANDGHPQ
ncbi:hypothetical protein [Rhodococcus sp. OK302]|uniref:hypothetical protein n=1 Tax=Rhodococcus sp. OK302 TaxID=1882769 RepID=UPI000B93A794|nr:hypothetical protein [Rhodococcus sp. OK302]